MSDRIRAALEELVAVKDLEDRVNAMAAYGFNATVSVDGSIQWDARRVEYDQLVLQLKRRQPEAWYTARKVLATESELVWSPQRKAAWMMTAVLGQEKPWVVDPSSEYPYVIHSDLQKAQENSNGLGSAEPSQHHPC